MEDENIQDGKIPISVLNSINEHAIGGFVLFFFNSNDSSPEHVYNMDSPICHLAMQKYIADWSASIQQVNIENIKKQISFDEEDTE